ncbi:MAG: FMN-binding protein [Minisyncoccota bacterium]
MKKLLATAFLVGASVLYVFFRPGSATTPAAFGATQSPARTSGATSVASSGSASAPPPPAAAAQGAYKDGTYTGSVADAYYGPVEVQATIKGGALNNVSFLLYPNGHQTSVYINEQVMPMLTQEAISAQSANVNGISGATFTSQAFQQSLAVALRKAKG